MKKYVNIQYKGITKSIKKLMKTFMKIIVPWTFVVQLLLEFSDNILPHPAVHGLKA